MNTSLNAAATIPAAFGTPFAGGFYFGQINKAGETFALIVSPKMFGEFKGRWGASAAFSEGPDDYADGLANTDAMAAAGSELAQAVRAAIIEGHDDWYIPSRDELELLYRNLKPTDEENYASFSEGENPSSVPMGRHYSEEHPKQTDAAAFREGGDQALEARWHWSSTPAGPSTAWLQGFGSGYQGDYHRTSEGSVRAVRRLKI